MKTRVCRGRYSCSACDNFIFPGQTYTISRRGKTHYQPACKQAEATALTEPCPHTNGREAQKERLLWSSIQRSREDRICCICSSWEEEYESDSVIWAGDEYIREVWSIPSGEFWENLTKLEVRFRHYPECHNPDDDPPEEGKKKRGVEKCPLALAA